MRLPGWIETQGYTWAADPRTGARRVELAVRLRLWHPGCWRAIWRSLPLPVWLRPLALLYVLARCARRQHRTRSA